MGEITHGVAYTALAALAAEKGAVGLLDADVYLAHQLPAMLVAKISVQLRRMGPVTFDCYVYGRQRLIQFGLSGHLT